MKIRHSFSLSLSETYKMFECEEKHTTKRLTPRLDFAPKQPFTMDPRQFETCRRVSLAGEGSRRKAAKQGDGTKRGRQQRGGRGEKEEGEEEDEEKKRHDEEMKRRKRKVEKRAKETRKPGN